jgi:hypothetical protein
MPTTDPGVETKYLPGTIKAAKRGDNFGWYDAFFYKNMSRIAHSPHARIALLY